MLSFLLLGESPIGMAQTLNWNSLDETKHIIHAGAGWDYSLSFILGYGYQVNTRLPLLLNASFSIPSGETLLDDSKAKLGSQLLVLNKPNFKGSIALNALYRRYENPLVRLQNVGAEMKGAVGYYKSTWFIAGEIGFDKAIVTHFRHSDAYRENIYSEVEDGWFDPASGGNFLYGFQTGYSFAKSDLTLNLGKVTTQDFKSAPLIPFYFMIGYNYRIK